MSTRRRSIKRHSDGEITVRNFAKDGKTDRGKTDWTVDETKTRPAVHELRSQNNIQNEPSGREVRSESQFITFDLPNVKDGSGDVKRSEIDFDGRTYSVESVERSSDHVRLVASLMK